MKNLGTILLSAGVLLVGFSLITPLLFFLIGVLLSKGVDATMLLQMEYALLSFIGLVLLVLGSVFSLKPSLTIIVSSSIAVLTIVFSRFVSTPMGRSWWAVTCCHYLFLLIAFGSGIAVLHTKGSSKAQV